jgi:hypothetical protein
MANISAPSGLWPVKSLTGAPWNEQGRLYYIATDSSNTYAIGDVVKLAGGADANGIAAVTKAATTDVPVGVIVGFRVSDPGVSLQGTTLSLETTYLGKSAGARYAYVVDDPSVVFKIESDSTGTAAADVGKNAGMSITADQTSSLSQSSPYASTTLSAATYKAQGTSGSLALPLTIIGIEQRPDNAVGAYADVLVIFNKHQYKQAQGTA